jgi:DNA-binding SARP family transcriptional activator
MFWGDKDESQATGSLRNAIYLLRKALPEHFKASGRSLFLENVENDIDSVTILADAAKPMPSFFFKEPLRGFDSLDLPEFGEWLSRVRGSLKKKIVEQIKNRITSCYELELREELIDSLSALLVFDPFDEDSLLELMEAYRKAGRVAEAVASYDAYRAKLESEFGVSPGERAREFLRKTVAAASGQSDTNRSGEVFCCRDAEVQKILDAALRSSRTLLVFIHGEAGVGKSALVNHVVGSALFAKAECFIARPLSIGEKYPYSSWNGLVSQLGTKLEKHRVAVDPAMASLLSGVFYEFMKKEGASHAIDIPARAGRDPAMIGKMLAGLVARFSNVTSQSSFLSPSEASPVATRPLFIFEDLHLFDLHSLSLLKVFLSEIRFPLTVFMTSRPESASSVMELLYAVKPAVPREFVQIPLSPFGIDEILHFCRSFLPQEVLLHKGEEYFIRESEGMPLLLAEMRRMLMERPDADCSAGLKGLILCRMEDMSPLQREFLSVLSVFGFGASIDEAAMVMKLESQELAESAEGLLRGKMICEKWDDGRVLLDLFHANVRECVYESIPGFKRVRLHSRIAEILNRRYSPQIWNPTLSSVLRHHYTMAGLKEDVLKQHLREMSFQITLNHVLFPLVEDKVLLTCSIPFSGREDTEEKIARVRDLLSALEDSDDAAKAVENKKLEASYCEIYGGYLINWGEYRKGRLFIDRALKFAKEHDFDEIQIYCLEHIGHHYLQTDDNAGLLSTGRRILHLAKKMGKENHMGLALRFIGMSKLITGDFSNAEKIFQRSIKLFEELELIGRRYTPNLLASRCYIGEMRQWMGDLDTAARHFDYCIKRCADSGLFWGRSHFHAHAADAALDMGDWSLVYSNIDTGAALFESSRGGHCGSLLYSLKAICDAKRGNPAAALTSLRNADFLSAIGKKTWCAAQLMAKAWIASMAEKGEIESLPFENYFTKPSLLYAQEAEKLYREIGANGRAQRIENVFRL